jgi:hypothetical protein
MTETLTRLWSLTDEELSDSPPDWNNYFDPIGLILQGKLESADYWCTPMNSVTFASTGGDGVHYGLLDIGQGFSESSPVVMTVPMCDTPNTIVGANLLEFLALGCRQGYFSLEQIIYQREAEIDALDSATFEKEAGEDEIRLLTSITTHFDLKPWADHESRLRSLEDEFFGRVTAKTEPD